MKIKSQAISIFFIYTSVCGTAQSQTNEDLFIEFHDYYNNGNLLKVADLLSDDFLIFNTNLTSNTAPVYLEFLANWDVPLAVKWVVDSFRVDSNTIISWERDTCELYNYSCATIPTIKYVYHFTGNKIQRIDCFDLTDNKSCESQINHNVQNFILWLQTYHPEEFPVSSNKELAEKIGLYFQEFAK